MIDNKPADHIYWTGVFFIRALKIKILTFKSAEYLSEKREKISDYSQRKEIGNKRWKGIKEESQKLFLHSNYIFSFKQTVYEEKNIYKIIFCNVGCAFHCTIQGLGPGRET